MQTWPDNIEEFQDPDAGPDIICNSLQIEEKFDPFKEFSHLFPKKKPLKLLPLRQPMEIMQHKINIIPESTWMPKWKDNNKMSEYYITHKINKKLATGRMRLSQLDNCIWMFTILKTDKKEPRLLIDCIPRNKVIIKDLTPLPNIKEIINWVAARKFKSKLDLTDGYHNIRLHPNLVKHNTILTHMGKFDSLVMLQGDCNAPATMMRAMN